MAEFALLINSELKDYRVHEERPPNIPHKGVSWHPVVRTQGEAAFEALMDDDWVICTALPTLGEKRQTKLADLAAVRWEHENGGTTFNGALVATDGNSQTKYIGAVVAAQIEPTTVISWKMLDGSFVELNATAIVELAMAVRGHVQACFDRERELRALIEAAQTFAELEAVDITSGWPGQQ